MAGHPRGQSAVWGHVVSPVGDSLLPGSAPGTHAGWLPAGDVHDRRLVHRKMGEGVAACGGWAEGGRSREQGRGGAIARAEAGGCTKDGGVETGVVGCGGPGVLEKDQV